MSMEEDIRTSLWNTAVSSADFNEPADKYVNVILGQCGIYVEMADRVSARRALGGVYATGFIAALLTAP